MEVYILSLKKIIRAVCSRHRLLRPKFDPHPLNQDLYKFSCNKQLFPKDTLNSICMSNLKKIITAVFEISTFYGPIYDSLYPTFDFLIFSKKWNSNQYTDLTLHIKLDYSVFFHFENVMVRRLHTYTPQA